DHQSAQRQLPRRAGSQRGLRPGDPELRPDERLVEQGRSGRLTVALLEVRDLRVSFSTADGVVEAVRGLAFDGARGSTFGIVGAPGSSKSVSTQSIVGLVRGASVTGEAYLDGTVLLHAPRRELRSILGRRIGMIFQDPLTSL